ncbi:MAG: hypothetical protein KF681_02645 [Bdellovibrionaceae bacterium]|nr:hypothetical protein [Pseudobdellovibrionaceae bacterium]
MPARLLAVSLLNLILTSVAFAAEPKGLPTFDFYAAPLVGVSSGKYEATGKVDGDTMGYHLGARVGVKLGPVLLGGEFNTTKMLRSAGTQASAQADQIKYTRSEDMTITMAGLNLGLMTDRVVLWGNYYPASGIDIEFTEAGTKYKNEYKGPSSSVDLNFRIWNQLYFGLFASQSEMKKYSTNHSSGQVKDADLDPSFTVKSYGITISYLIPFSELGKLSKAFPQL